MEKKTEGAWIVHHGDKLRSVANTIEFQEIEFASKCGVMLSSIASDDQVVIPRTRVEAMAKAAKLNVHTDLPAILSKLSAQNLIDLSKTGDISVLGLSTSAVLGHTSDIFNSTSPSIKQIAAINLAEETSRTPGTEKDLKEWASDAFKLSNSDTTTLLHASADIGFVDSQPLDNTSRLYFNGHLFRVDNTSKISAILNSLSQKDRELMSEVESLLSVKGCIEEETAKRILGPTLYNKLHSIGIFDLSSVHNDHETTCYITRPGAFGKYGSNIDIDAFDLAKAFIASLTYGMTKSSSSRGKIELLNLLLNKLIRGGTLNPSTAAGQDYRILELKGVVEVKHATGSMFTMRLLKKEIGVLAKQILNFGDASENSLANFPGASVISYTAPEENRTTKRRSMEAVERQATARLLEDIRTGGYK